LGFFLLLALVPRAAAVRAVVVALLAFSCRACATWFPASQRSRPDSLAPRKQSLNWAPTYACVLADRTAASKSWPSLDPPRFASSCCWVTTPRSASLSCASIPFSGSGLRGLFSAPPRAFLHRVSFVVTPSLTFVVCSALHLAAQYPDTGVPSIVEALGTDADAPMHRCRLRTVCLSSIAVVFAALHSLSFHCLFVDHAHPLHASFACVVSRLSVLIHSVVFFSVCEQCSGSARTRAPTAA
jgi:hypothetical protein